MSPQTLRNILTIVLGAALPLGCASGPSPNRVLTLATGQRAVVAIQQGETLSLSLVNASALTPDQAQAERKADPNLKVIPDAEVQRLLDVFGGLKFFEMASDFADPEARSWILVQHGNKKYIASGRRPRAKDNTDQALVEIQRFSDCINAFNSIYSANDNFAGSKMSARDFKEASRAINESSREIRSKRGDGRKP